MGKRHERYRERIERGRGGLMSGTLRVGTDLVQISRIAASRAQFGEKFLRRVFTEREITYALSSPPHTDARLAARFAAKEATVKALNLVELGVSWQQIEVCREASGACTIALYGAAAEVAQNIGAAELALSLSHDGDYATAVVVTQIQQKS